MNANETTLPSSHNVLKGLTLTPCCHRTASHKGAQNYWCQKIQTVKPNGLIDMKNTRNT